MKNKYFLSDTAATSINKTEDATKSNLCLGPQMGLTTLTRGNATVICKYIFSFIPNLFRTSRLLQYLGLFRFSMITLGSDKFDLMSDD